MQRTDSFIKLSLMKRNATLLFIIHEKQFVYTQRILHKRNFFRASYMSFAMKTSRRGFPLSFFFLGVGKQKSWIFLFYLNKCTNEYTKVFMIMTALLVCRKRYILEALTWDT